ncbi:MAG: BatA domain-containing protein [Flavobacteriaceae bacterium]|nr:BatA domain-containing protein [Flavobacteriaceae bacterium]
MSFLNPTYLWALLGLIVPIAIHLWSKKEGKTVKIGSIELLRESESKQTSSIQPNELLLLLLRILIITLVVFVLAEPQIKLKTDKTAITYIIEPSLLDNDKSENILNSIEGSKDVRLLTSGFPYLEDIDLENISKKTPNYWQLAKEMQNIDSDSIVVYTKALASGFKGMRPSINKTMEWIIFDTEALTENLPIKARKVDDNVELLSMLSNANYTSFEKKLINESDFTQTELELVEENPVKIVLYYEDTFINDSKYLEASLNAASKHINRTFEITKTQDHNFDTEGFDLTIWLSNQSALPKGVKKTLLFQEAHLSHSLIEESSVKNLFYLTNHLNTENSLDHFLPEQLLNILDINQDVKQVIEENDKRSFSKAELLPTFSDIKITSKKANYTSISKWLWLILGLTLLCERIVANYRKQ